MPRSDLGAVGDEPEQGRGVDHVPGHSGTLGTFADSYDAAPRTAVTPGERRGFT